MSSGKRKSEQRWNTTPHLLRMTEIQNLDKGKHHSSAGHQKLSFVAVGMQNGTAALEDTFAVCCKIKHPLMAQSINHTSCYLPNRAENLRPHKNLQMMFIVALFIIAQTGKQPRYPVVGEQVLHPDNGMLFVQG